MGSRYLGYRLQVIGFNKNGLQIHFIWLPDYKSGRATKDYQGALNDMNLYLSIPSNNAQDYLFRGKLYAQLNNHSDAILDFNKAIDVDSSYDQAYMYRGISKAELNQNDACSDLLKAKELGLKDTSQYLEKYCH